MSENRIREAADEAMCEAATVLREKHGDDLVRAVLVVVSKIPKSHEGYERVLTYSVLGSDPETELGARETRGTLYRAFLCSMLGETENRYVSADEKEANKNLDENIAERKKLREEPKANGSDRTH